ncbi:MAG TPA: isoprenylcysteine carboxylmethyltransferase family protein [Cyclobacteriaceae bacterium]|nr:isoprenylcysteine carboxylmethyltransferase family protein [Cyclobacteriaceae bacterium]
MNWIKQIISLILPLPVWVIIPVNIENNRSVVPGWNFFAGLMLIATGLTMMGLTISSFIRIGRGTLAPWSPTKKLVVKGLYRYVRNPMILGVLLVLLGESACIWSVALLQWAGLFFVINTAYFIAYEEPGLEARFGTEYLDYKNRVSRWIPRLTPYNPGKK